MPPAPDINSDDYYKVLGVDRTATESEIGKAYKKMALKYHPDKNPDDKVKAEENFKKVTEAYEVLRDSDKRKSYDQFGKKGLGAGGMPGGGVSFQQADEIFKAFFGGADPFSMFFGGDDEDGPFGGRGMPGGPRVVFRNAGGGSPNGMGGIGGMPFGFNLGGMGGMPGMGMPGMSMPGGMPRGAAPRARPDPPPSYAMPLATPVVVRGLSSAKAQEHNGKIGKITGWDQSKARYEVELDSDTSLWVKPTNLTQRCSGVRIVGIESQPELNDKTGEILSYDAEKGRYTVRLKERLASGKDCVGLQPLNVVLPKGTRVVTQGLKTDELNGQLGQITEIDEETMKYTVLCQNGKAIKISYDKVVC